MHTTRYLRAASLLAFPPSPPRPPLPLAPSPFAFTWGGWCLTNWRIPGARALALQPPAPHGMLGMYLHNRSVNVFAIGRCAGARQPAGRPGTTESNAGKHLRLAGFAFARAAGGGGRKAMCAPDLTDTRTRTGDLVSRPDSAGFCYSFTVCMHTVGSRLLWRPLNSEEAKVPLAAHKWIV